VHDVGVRDARDGLRFSSKAREKLLPCGLVEVAWRLQDLERDRALERRLLGPIDDPEAPLGNDALYGEASLKRGSRELLDVASINQSHFRVV
jgi:hypothetical protein